MIRAGSSLIPIRAVIGAAWLPCGLAAVGLASRLLTACAADRDGQVGESRLF